MLTKYALEKKAEDAEREFYWWLAGATFLQLWSAGYSYAEILWMINSANITFGDKETL